MARRRVAIARKNIGLCFPEFSKAEQNNILQQSFRGLAALSLEMAWTWWKTDEWFANRCEISGQSQLAALEKRGVILLLGHFTTLEISGPLMALHNSLYVSQKSPKNNLLGHFLLNKRAKRFAENIDHRDIRRVVRRLREKKSVVFIPDQDTSAARGGVIASFFGIPAYTGTATARMANLTQAAVVPVMVKRDWATARYQLRYSPPLENFPSGDDCIDAQAINKVFEEQIRQAPDLYMWVHTRFAKANPEIYDTSL